MTNECKYCGKKLQNSGAKVLHERYCKAKGCCDNPDYRLLNPNDPDEERELKKGSLEICKNCDNVKEEK